MIFIKKALAGDLEKVYPLLSTFEPKITKEGWGQLFVDHCGSGEGYFGYVLVDQDKAVGFLGLIFSKRLINGEEQKFCNMTSWIVKKEYRGKTIGLSLLNEVIQLKDYTITNLTAGDMTVPILKRYGFKELETNFKIIIPLPAIDFSLKRCRIESDPETIKNILTSEDLKIYNDHAKFNIIHLVIKTEDGNCYLILKKAVRKKLIFAQIHYLSNLDIFVKFSPCLIIKICFCLKVFGLLIEERFLRGQKIKHCLVSKLVCPNKFFKSTKLDKSDITDNLYTELLVLNI